MNTPIYFFGGFYTDKRGNKQFQAVKPSDRDAKPYTYRTLERAQNLFPIVQSHANLYELCDDNSIVLRRLGKFPSTLIDDTDVITLSFPAPADVAQELRESAAAQFQWPLS